MAAEDCFGPSLKALKGKTTRTNTPTTPSRMTAVPLMIHERYRRVTLGMDIMFINKIAFLVTISKDIRFGTIEHLRRRGEDDILSAIKRVITLYGSRGFIVRQIDADGEFENLRGALLEECNGCHLNITSNDEHEKATERCIRTIKERVRGTWTTLPFERIPDREPLNSPRTA